MAEQQHSLILENRAALSLTGVTEIVRFDERKISLFTRLGPLTITGRSLHVKIISLETGELAVDGEIWGMQYGDRDRCKPAAFTAKLLR